MSAERKDATIDIRVRPSVKAAARDMAEADQRTLSNFIAWLIDEERKRRAARPQA